MSEDLKKYQVDVSMTLAQRAAHFLIWVADNNGEQIVTMAQIVKTVMTLPRMPKPDSSEVADFRIKKMSRIRHILLHQYKRNLISIRGVGYRASVDSLDAAKAALPVAKQRAKSSLENLELVRSTINLAEISDKAIAADVRKVDSLRKYFNTDEVMKLLEPAKKKKE